MLSDLLQIVFTVLLWELMKSLLFDRDSWELWR